MEIINSPVLITITIGGGLELALDHRNNLLLFHEKNRTSVNLGPLTQQRAKELGEYLQRLAIHTPER